MPFHLITGVHGTVALILLCTLLFIDEAGVPLPFAPNELLLIVAGLLISTGGLNPFVFFPIALLAMCGGVLTAYGWARAIGPPGLRRFAGRLHAQHHYDHAAKRLQDANPVTIFVARMLPGVRIYATLICGAAAVPRRRFALGAFPAATIWCFFFTFMGVVFGIPAEHVLSRVQQVLFRAGLLIALGLGAYLAARHVPPDEEQPQPLFAVPAPGRFAVAIALDFGILASILLGIGAFANFILHIHARYAWAELAGLLGALAIMYIIVSRRGPGATIGERLFDVTYRKLTVRYRTDREGGPSRPSPADSPETSPTPPPGEPPEPEPPAG